MLLHAIVRTTCHIESSTQGSQRRFACPSVFGGTRQVASCVSVREVEMVEHHSRDCMARNDHTNSSCLGEMLAVQISTDPMDRMNPDADSEFCLERTATVQSVSLNCRWCVQRPRNQRLEPQSRGAKDHPQCDGSALAVDRWQVDSRQTGSSSGRNSAPANAIICRGEFRGNESQGKTLIIFEPLWIIQAATGSRTGN